jgi:hypothetical protein
MRFRQPDDVFQVRISLTHITPSIWRRVLVPQEIVLPRLHAVAQVVMGWTDSHLHRFRVGDVHLAEPSVEDYEPLPLDYRKIAFNQIARYRGSTCIYEYDFGDGWEHLIEVEDELPIETMTSPLPQCIGGERACPPEDCGGPHGYEEFVAAIRDPCHEEHEQCQEWAGDNFDPEAFDLDLVNRRLARLVRRQPPARRPTRQTPRR